MTSAFERQRAAVEDRLNLIVNGTGAVATTAASALSGAIPEIALNVDGAPEVPLSNDDKSLVEHALCRILYHLVDAAGEARIPCMKFTSGAEPALPRLLDLSLFISEQGICDHGVIFTVLEQLVEACTISDCEQVFTWVEGERTRLSVDALWRRGKLVMLRTCNELLRRLSKTHDTVLRGRVLLLLSSLYPLSERSALNLAGSYNRSNTTELDDLSLPPSGAEQLGTTIDAMDTDSGSGAAMVDTVFYRTFWSLQLFFQQPPTTLSIVGGWDAFYAGLQVVLDNFEMHRLDPQSAACRTTTREAEALGTKYLTAAPLLQLQLRDPSFRRHFLLQCAILLGFCTNPPPSAAGALVINKEEMAAIQKRVISQLSVTPPHGADFAAAVSHLLLREQGWTVWKQNNCKDFERAAAPAPAPVAPAPAMRRRPRPGAAQPAVPPEKRVKLGNLELDRLWNLSMDNTSALGDKKGKTTPSLPDFLQPVIDDMDPTAEIEEYYKSKNDKVFTWKALRLIAKENLGAFSRLGTEDMEAVIPGLLGVEAPGKAAADAKAATTAATTAAAAATAEKTLPTAVESAPASTSAGGDKAKTSGEGAPIVGATEEGKTVEGDNAK